MLNRMEDLESQTKRTEEKFAWFEKSNFRALKYYIVLVLFAGMMIGGGISGSVQGGESLQKPAESTSESPAQRLRRDGIRAMNCGDIAKTEAVTVMERMASAGFNLVLPWNPANSPLKDAVKTSRPDSSIILHQDDIPKEHVARLRDFALKCKKNNVILMHTLYTAAASEVRYLTGLEAQPDGGHIYKYVQFEDRDLRNSRVRKLWPAHLYRHVVGSDGSRKTWAPCPLERRYWMGLIRPELEFVARVLNETGTDGGATLELESYCFYHIYPGYASQKTTFCYCDECFYGFADSLEGNDPPDAVPPNKRLNWLTLRGLLSVYEQSLEDRMALIIREMMQAVRKINPDFMFGIYPYAPHWYYDALIRGSGTSDLPTLLFSSAEYNTGYRNRTDPSYTFSSEVSTCDGIAHLRQRGLHALYAGGLYDKGIKSPEAYALAADKLLRNANGYWVYRELHKSGFEPFWKHFPSVNRWNREHPDPLPPGSFKNVLPGALKLIGEQSQPGLLVNKGHIVASYQTDVKDALVIAQPFDDEQELKHELQGRKESFPPLDKEVVHSGKVSVRFDSVPGTSPRAPYIEYAVQGKKERKEQFSELSFWVKTESEDPVRLYVGTAMNTQHPVYMWYHNFILPIRDGWTRMRIAPVISKNMKRFDMLRFWPQAIAGKLWVDDIQVRPVQERVIDVPLELPENASDWGQLEWRLSPADAVAHAELIASDDNRIIQKRIYSGDSLAPLMSIVGREPVRLRLRVYPSAQENVVLEEVRMGSVQLERP